MPANRKFSAISCSFPPAQPAKKWFKIDRASKKGVSPQNCKRRTVWIILLKRHFIIIVSFQNISPHLGDLHLKITIRTQRREKRFGSQFIFRCNKKKITTCKHTIVSSNCTCEKKAITIPRVALAPPSSVRKENKRNDRHYSGVSVLLNFVDNVELNGA